jgi:hypothetical protein
LKDPTLRVLFFPLPNATAKTCGLSSAVGYLSDSTNFVAFSTCTLYIRQSGFVFVDASAGAGLSATGGEWEGQFSVGVDNAFVVSRFSHWVNVYSDSGKGTNRALAICGLIGVTRGMHTFYFVGKRYAGTGQMLVWTPSITVIAPSTAARITAIPNQTVAQNLPTETIPFTFTTFLGPDATILQMALSKCQQCNRFTIKAKYQGFGTTPVQADTNQYLPLSLP